MLEPRGLGDAVGSRRLMTEDIHIEGALGVLAERRIHSARALRIGRTHANRTQRTGVGYRRSQRRRGHPGHRGLDDRQIDRQCFE